MLEGSNLSVAKEEKEHLTKNIDKCYNNPSSYQIQVVIDLMTKAQYLLQQKSYYFWIDDQRILAYDAGSWIPLR
ncbi:hypothetical protein Goari_002681 [Gossypium aridum]|uniref:Uncharacterized protein n=1 Tax=Gossypium aridum TaxID=34290 RepID=A0A7J8Y945_GOSAI|nr:hypothetical protein [Gossypium aridum]